MNDQNRVISETAAEVEAAEPSAGRPAGLGSLILLSAWCGLTGGLLEVLAVIVRKRFFDENHLLQMSRHFVWLLPVANGVMCLTAGLVGCALILVAPQRGRWIVGRGLCALAILPAALVGFPQIYGLALVFVALGLASWLVPSLEREPLAPTLPRGSVSSDAPRRRGTRAAGAAAKSFPRRSVGTRSPGIRATDSVFRRIVLVTLPIELVLVAILAAAPWVSDGFARAREQSRAMPPPGSPNVLLIVMDTVAAGHLRLYGHNLATSTSLADLAERGTSFARAQSASSWTLPSHAAMFTGRWMHELRVGWRTPLDGARPTVAEYLGSKGYATAGFVANMAYCARGSGLARGFTTYSDYIFPKLTAFRKAALISRTLDGLQAIVKFVEDDLAIAQVRAYVHMLTQWFDKDRKQAAVVNRELLDWLTSRAQPERPFFAFLNYFDAHYPYLLPDGRYHRFGGAPTDFRQRAIIEEWGALEKNQVTPNEVAFAARAYDECIADLDEQVGRLTDRLRRDGVLDQTWLIVVADHGESFGEHTGVFCHGVSLYQTEVHVPLVIVPPGGAATKRVITEAVSLGDLAATIVDLAGLTTGSPFPGESLARYWDGSKSSVKPEHKPADPTLAEVVTDPEINKPNRTARAKPTVPLGALKDAEWSYIRRDVDLHEELFRLGDDKQEEHNLASDPAMQPTLERLRATLLRKAGGPLTRQRFSP